MPPRSMVLDPVHAQCSAVAADSGSAFPDVARFGSCNRTEREIEAGLLNEPDLDFGVAAPYEAAPGLEYRHLFSLDWGLVAPPRHPLLHRPGLTLRDLADQPLICFERGSTGRQHVLDAFHALSLSPRIVMETTNTEIVVRMVEAGLGLSAGAAPAQRRRHPRPSSRRPHVAGAGAADSVRCAVTPQRRSVAGGRSVPRLPPAAIEPFGRGVKHGFRIETTCGHCDVRGSGYNPPRRSRAIGNNRCAEKRDDFHRRKLCELRGP